MSAAPTKSHSLHNFPSFSSSSAWKSNSTSAGSSSFTNVVAPPYDPEAGRAFPQAPVPHRGVGSRSSRHQRFSFTSLAPSPALKSETDREETVASAEKQRGRNKMKKNEEEGEEAEAKRTWNLRPRKGFSCSKKNDMFSPEMFGGSDGGEAHGAKQRAGGSEPKSKRLRGIAVESPAACGVEKRIEKRKLWIALSRDEIEEDIFIMTGNRPSRRPKKHPKMVQKQLDVSLIMIG